MEAAEDTPVLRGTDALEKTDELALATEETPVLRGTDALEKTDEAAELAAVELK
jgi:hypothetical protein